MQWASRWRVARAVFVGACGSEWLRVLSPYVTNAWMSIHSRDESSGRLDHVRLMCPRVSSMVSS